MGNLQLWKRVPAVADSSLLHLVHLLEWGVFPGQKLEFPHFLHSKLSFHFIAAINSRHFSSLSKRELSSS
jgi:hypothetical protein